MTAQLTLARLRAHAPKVRCFSPRCARPPGEMQTAASGGNRSGGASHNAAGELRAPDYHRRAPLQAPSRAQASADDPHAPYGVVPRPARALRGCDAVARKPEEGAGGADESLFRAALCARLGVDRGTLRRWLKAGKFPSADLVLDGRAAWSKRAVDQWERDGRALSRVRICAQLGIDRTTLWRWLKSGRFPGADLLLDGGRVAWSARAVEDWQRAEAKRLAEEEARKLEELRRRAAVEAEIGLLELAESRQAWRDEQRRRAAAPPRKTAQELEAELYAQCGWANDSALPPRNAHP